MTYEEYDDICCRGKGDDEMADYCCKGCSRRKVGCKRDCMDYLVESIMSQPEKERMAKQKAKAVLLTSDKYSRINRFHPMREEDLSPCRSRKK